MLQAREPSITSYRYEWQPPSRRRVVRCLFGRPCAADIKRALEEELNKQIQRFCNRYEICEPAGPTNRTDVLERLSSPGTSRTAVLERLSSPVRNSQNLVTKETSSPLKRRMEELSFRHKRQRLLTDYWAKTKDSYTTVAKTPS